MNHLKPYITSPENAIQMAEWIRDYGGIAIWLSADLSKPADTVATPALTAEGEPQAKPAWWTSKSPACIVTDPADVLVSRDLPVKRFRVSLRQAGNGLAIKCTPGASRRIRAEVAKAGEGAYHVFDYSTREAVIMKPLWQMLLLDYLNAQNTPDIRLVKTETASKVYEGLRDPVPAGDCMVFVNDQMLLVGPSLQVYDFKPLDGVFSWQWGYRNQLQLSLAILLDYFGDPQKALRYHRYFWSKFVVGRWLSLDGWELKGSEIDAFVVDVDRAEADDCHAKKESHQR
jgi:hypothetical protein